MAASLSKSAKTGAVKPKSERSSFCTAQYIIRSLYPTLILAEIRVTPYNNVPSVVVVAYKSLMQSAFKSASDEKCGDESLISSSTFNHPLPSSWYT